MTKGEDKLSQALDVVKVIKQLRTLTLFYKNTSKPNEKLMIENNQDHIIHIDTDSDES